MNLVKNVQVEFIMNVPIENGDVFIKKQKYKYVFNNKPKITFIIELEHYDYNIVVISFYPKKKGNERTRYRLRHNFPGIAVLRILQACLKLYKDINKNLDHALVFKASDDVGEFKEDNDRFGVYIRFLNQYFLKDNDDYKYDGSAVLSTMCLYHKAIPSKCKVLRFFNEFNEKVKEQIQSSDYISPNGQSDK